MPQSIVTLASETWGPAIALASGAKLRVQNVGGNIAIAQAFPNSTTPTGSGPTAGGVYLWPRKGEVLDTATHFPGVASPTHIRFWGTLGGTRLSISHG